MKWMYKTCVLLFVLGSVLTANAQMEVLDANTPPLDPINLINNVFLGAGVDVLDVTFEGDNAAIGLFKNATTEIRLDRGIVMTSGRAESDPAIPVVGADADGGDFASNSNTGFATDPDADAVASGTVNDLAIFKITFIPIADTLRFRYVFGSEEYPEFTCSDYNDIFGFFISGPGINGPYENDGENIALIPGTNLPVTINNLNSGNVGANGEINNCTPPNGSLAYSQFYNNNNNSPFQPVYDGFTTVLTAEAVVIPCETYTIKLMVADVGDSAFDSGVFLEAKSFGTGTLDVQASTLSLDGAIAEGCEPGSLVFELPIAPLVDLPLDYNIFGTAINGVDYETIPDDLFIPAGDTMITIPIVAINDGITEGEETIFIDIQLNVCTRDTITVKIADNPLLPSAVIEDTLICEGEPVSLDGTLPVVIPPPQSFTNDTDIPIFPPQTGIFSPITVSGVFPELIGPGVIESVCLNIEHRWVDDLDIFLVAPDGQFIELSTHNGANGDDYVDACFTPVATTPISFPGPWAPASAAPFTGDWQPEGPWADLYGSRTNGDWDLLITDQAPGFDDGTILDWTITFAQIYDIFYEWTPNTSLTCVDCPATEVTPVDSTQYTIIATDTYGCVLRDSVDVNVLDTLPPPEISCDITNSSIDFSWLEIPGSEGYEVNIEGGGWILPNDGPLSHLISGLPLDDTISIAVRGISDCGVRVDTVRCATPICAVPDLMIDDLVNVSCFGANDGMVTLMATGGVGGFVYELNTISNSTGVFNSLSPGNYSVTVTDAISCSQTIDFEITEPVALQIEPTIIDSIDCFGNTDGIATITVQGGTAPYQFNWDGTQSDSIATGLAAGIHTVTVTDNNGCSQVEIVDLLEPTLLTFATDSTTVSCNGDDDGTATIIPAGGTMPYSYLWDANANNQTTATASNLVVGNYQVTLTDDENCTTVASIEITEPNELTADISGLNPNCPASNDGTATVVPIGGTPGYNFLWNDPAGSSTESVTDLGGEEYQVTVTDANGCTFDTLIQLVAPDSFDLQLQQTAVQCFDGNDGTAIAIVSNITGPETYQWDNGATQATNTGLGAIQHCVTVTDGNGCQQSDCITLTQPDELLLTTTATSAGCTGQSNGTIDLSVIGGTMPYTFAWSNSSTTEDLTTLSQGTYSVIVTDANDCTATTSVDIVEGAPFTLDFEVTDISCFDENDGAIDVTVVGGTGVDFTWSGPNGFVASTEDLTNLSNGNYVLTAIDPQGCTLTDSVLLSRPDSIVVSTTVEEVSCFEARDGRVTLIAEGGSSPYLYALGDSSALQSLAIFGNLSGGTYPFTVQDSEGCTFTDSLVVIEPEELMIDLERVVQVNLGQSHTYQATVNIENSEIDSIRWFPTDSLSCTDCLDPTVDAEYTTEYWVEVFASGGCYVKGFTLFVVDRQVSVYVPSAFSPNDDGINDRLVVLGKEGSIKEVKSFNVFNRWGGHLYSANNFQLNDPSIGWDGTLDGKVLNDGVFVWYAEIILLDGTSEILTGDAVLYR